MEEKDNRQVLIIQNDDEEDNKPHKWTWARYGRGIAVYKWWVIGVTVLVTVAGYLAVHFIVNPSKEKVTSQFTYNNIAMTSDGNGGGTYVDGTTFYYQDILSSANIEAVKASDTTSFGSVDTDGLIEKGISIELDKTSSTDGTTVVISSPNSYTITATMSYFGSQKTAASFIKALIELPNTAAQTAVKNNKATNVFTSNFASREFEDQLSMISSQYSVLLDRFNGIRNSFSSSTIINDTGLTISQEINIYKENYLYGGNSIFDYLNGQLLAHHYLNYTHTEEGRATKISELEAQGDAYKARLKETFTYQSIYEEQMKNLQTNGQIVTNSQYAEQIATLNDKITSLKVERQTIVKNLKEYGYSVPSELTADNVDSITTDPTADGKIQHLQNPTTDNWEDGCTTYQNKINEYKTLLSGSDMDLANSAYQYVYKNNKNTVSYSYSGIVQLSGHISSAIGVAVGLIIGFLGSSLICAAIWISKEVKKETEVAS